MKQIILSLLIIAGGTIHAQQAKKFFTALKAKDVQAMGALLEGEVELCIRDNTEFLSRKEALTRISRFLDNHTPVKVTPIHGGSNKKNNSRYRVAKLKTDKGVFRVFVYMEKGGKIEEVRLDKF